MFNKNMRSFLAASLVTAIATTIVLFLPVSSAARTALGGAAARRERAGIAVVGARSRAPVGQRNIRPGIPLQPRGPSAGFNPAPGDPVFRLRIPAIGLEETVLQGADQTQLARGPGHYPSCESGFIPPYCAPFPEVWPGEIGRVVLGGHRSEGHADFMKVGRLNNKDRLYVGASWGNFVYEVTDTRVVSPTDRSIIVPGVPHRELVLVTCHPKYSAASRLLVYARLVGAFEPWSSATGRARPLGVLD